jgi:hypothetical protein
MQWILTENVTKITFIFRNLFAIVKHLERWVRMNVHLRAYWFARTTVNFPDLDFVRAFDNLPQVLPKCS